MLQKNEDRLEWARRSGLGGLVDNSQVGFTPRGRVSRKSVHMVKNGQFLVASMHSSKGVSTSILIYLKQGGLRWENEITCWNEDVSGTFYWILGHVN